MSHITNMANSLLVNTFKKQGMLRWDLSIHHWRWSFGYLSPGVNEHNNLALCQTGLCVCVCVGGGGSHLNMCMSFMHIPQPKRDPGPLLCGILINPVMTEWIWQVMYVLGLGWEGSEEKEHDSGVNAKPTKRHNTVSSRSTLGQVLVVGSLANSLTTQSHRLSPQIRPAWPETEKHMASVDSGKCYEYLMNTINQNIYLYLSHYYRLKKYRLAVCLDCLLIHSWSCPEVQLIWAALMRIWPSVEDVLSPLVSLLCGICHFNDHLSSHFTPSVIWI